MQCHQRYHFAHVFLAHQLRALLTMMEFEVAVKLELFATLILKWIQFGYQLVFLQRGVLLLAQQFEILPPIGVLDSGEMNQISM